MKTKFTFYLLFAVGLLTSGQVLASSAETPKTTDIKPAAASGNTSTGNAAASLQTDNYKLRPTDVIHVNVVDDSRAVGDFRVSVDGTVQLTYLNDQPIKVVGLSTGDAAKLIIKTYVDSGIFVKPSITVSVTEYAPQRVNFIGQVIKPGPVFIPPSKKLTLVNAFSEAGGPTNNAAGTVDITRINPDGTTTTLKNVDLLGATKDAKKDIPLQEGDTITLGQSLLGDVWH